MKRPLLGVAPFRSILGVILFNSGGKSERGRGRRISTAVGGDSSSRERAVVSSLSANSFFTARQLPTPDQSSRSQISAFTWCGDIWPRSLSAVHPQVFRWRCIMHTSFSVCVSLLSTSKCARRDKGAWNLHTAGAGDALARQAFGRQNHGSYRCNRRSNPRCRSCRGSWRECSSTKGSQRLER